MFCNFIFLKKIERAGWFEVGGGGSSVGCHVTSQQGKPVDLAVTARVSMKQ
jgi:hypothetical protein